MSPITTDAPARASACAIPSPSPRAPPVTSAFRPVRSYTLIWYLFLGTPPQVSSGQQGVTCLIAIRVS